jgi:hypothetical protein
MMVLERPTDCIVFFCLSSILRGIPLSGGGDSPSPVFTAVVLSGIDSHVVAESV